MVSDSNKTSIRLSRIQKFIIPTVNISISSTTKDSFNGTDDVQYNIEYVFTILQNTNPFFVSVWKFEQTHENTCTKHEIISWRIN